MADGWSAKQYDNNQGPFTYIIYTLITVWINKTHAK